MVNLASECGYTDSHYRELTSLYNELATEKGKPFSILGFPCNQFGEQEPHDNEEIEKFATETYGARFPIFAKTNVADLAANPAFRYLKGWRFFIKILTVKEMFNLGAKLKVLYS